MRESLTHCCFHHCKNLMLHSTRSFHEDLGLQISLGSLFFSNRIDEWCSTFNRSEHPLNHSLNSLKDSLMSSQILTSRAQFEKIFFTVNNYDPSSFIWAHVVWKLPFPLTSTTGLDYAESEGSIRPWSASSWTCLSTSASFSGPSRRGASLMGLVLGATGIECCIRLVLSTSLES